MEKHVEIKTIKNNILKNLSNLFHNSYKNLYPPLKNHDNGCYGDGLR